jgi:hypothetical protein
MCYFVLPVILLVIRRAGEKEWLSFLTSRTMESKSKESFTVSELKGHNSFLKKQDIHRSSLLVKILQHENPK